MHIHYNMYVNIIDIGAVNSVYIMNNQAGTTHMQFVMIYATQRTPYYDAHTCRFAMHIYAHTLQYVCKYH